MLAPLTWFPRSSGVLVICVQVESGFDLKTLIAIEVVFFAVAEAFRVASWKKTGAVSRRVCTLLTQ